MGATLPPITREPEGFEGDLRITGKATAPPGFSLDKLNHHKR